MVLARQQLAELFVRHLFGRLAQFFRAPAGFYLTRGSEAVALRKPRPRQREAALCGEWRLLGKERADGRGVHLLLPQPRLGTTAQQRVARPVRIAIDEGRKAGEARVGFGMAQQEPFDELLPGGIGNRLCSFGGVGRLALAREIDRVLHQGQIAGQRGRGRFLVLVVIIIGGRLLAAL